MSTHNVLRALLAGLLTSLSSGNLVFASLIDDARNISWQTENLEAFSVLFPNAASVEIFLKEAIPDIAVIGASIGEYEITDLKNNGKLELVATIDSSGRAFYNTIYVVQKLNHNFQALEIWSPGTNILDLKSCVMDLNHDGVKELLVPRLLTSPQSQAEPHPIINDVYEWDGAGFRKANASFKNYYRSLLPHLESELDAVRHGKLADPSQKILLQEKYEKEIEEVDRILSE